MINFNFLRKKKDHPIPGSALINDGIRNEIHEYITFAFQNEYDQLQAEGSLESFLDDCEVFYSSSYASLKKIKFDKGNYFNDEDQMINYAHLAMTEVFQEISTKFTLQEPKVDQMLN